MPKVSIVIPVHNQPFLILEAVASLKALTVTDWEAILVDDGSTDETPTVLRSLARQDARILLSLQAQRGAAAARNTGAAMASSDWLLFLDSDDWLAPDALRSLLPATAPDVDLVHALGLRVCGNRCQDRSQVDLPSGDLFRRLASTATFMIHACLLRNSTFRELGGFDEALMGCADWDLWQRVVRSGARCRGVDEIVAYYRQTESSLSTFTDQELRDGLIVIARGHGRDPRVPRPHPDYADGILLTEFPAAAYRFASWMAGRAIGRGQPYAAVLKGIQSLPAEPLSACDIGAALFDAIPIGLGDFRPKWEICWSSLRPQFQEFSEKLAAISHCGLPFGDDVLRQIERLAAAADASDKMCRIGSIASRVIRIPGSIPHLSFTPEFKSFIAVVRSGTAELGLLDIPVDEKLSSQIIRGMIIERYLWPVVSAYCKHFIFRMLYGAMKYAIGRKKGIISSVRRAKRSQLRSSGKREIYQFVLAQDFILPVVHDQMDLPDTGVND